MTSLWVSVYVRRCCSRCRSSSGRCGRSSFRPSTRARAQTRCAASSLFATVLARSAGLAFGYFLVLPAAAALPDELRQLASTTSRSRRSRSSPSPSTSCSRWSSSSSCRSSSLGLTRIGDPHDEKLRKNRRIGLLHRLLSSALALPGRRSGHDHARDDPADRALRGLDLALGLLDRRGTAVHEA